MITYNRPLVAVERQKELRDAVGRWRAAFAIGEPIPAMGGTAFWHEELGVWGIFSEHHFKGASAGRYWNAFGQVTHSLSQNIIVEINPPRAGINRSVQGVIAVVPGRGRWILHRGRMAVPGLGITEAMFDATTGRDRVRVDFSDGTHALCYPVAPLDEGDVAIRLGVADFVAECARIRLFYIGGPQAAAQEAGVLAAEGSFDESRGSHVVGPQDAKLVRRRHADVWHALKREMEARGILHSNARVGRHGPDLRTITEDPVLFEIKTEIVAADLQQGLGQLLLYEQLLGTAHRKVLVLPDIPGTEMTGAMQALHVELLYYKRSGNRVTFSDKDINVLLQTKPG